MYDSLNVCLAQKEPRLTGLCCESVDKSLCNFTGSSLLPSFFKMLYSAGIVSCSPGRKIVHEDIALSASCKKGCGVLRGA